MRKRGLIWIAIGLTGLLFSVASSYLKDHSDKEVIHHLQVQLQKEIDRLDHQFRDTEDLKRCIEYSKDLIPDHLCNLIVSEEHLLISVYKKDSLVFWNQEEYPVRSLSRSIDSVDSWHLINKSGQFYLGKRISMPDFIVNQVIHLQTFFEDIQSGPRITSISLSSKPTQLFLSIADHKIFVEYFEEDLSSWRKLLSSLFYLIGFISLLVGTYFLLSDLIPKPPIRIALFMLLVLFIEWLTAQLPIRISFDDSLYTSPIFTGGWWQPTILELIIDILLLGGFVLLIINEVKITTPSTLKGKKRKYFYGAVHYFSLMGFLLFSAFAIRQMILHSDALLKIENLLSWDLFSIFLLGAIVIFISIVFLLSYYLHKQVRQLAFSMDEKLGLLLVASLALLPVYLLIQPGIHPFAFFIVAFIFVILLDLFTENLSGGLTWPFIWLSVFAGFTSLLIFTFSQDRLQMKERQFLTSNLSFEEAEKAYGISSSDFYIAQYKEGKRINFQGNLFSKTYPFDTLPPPGSLMSLQKDQFFYQIYQYDNDVVRVTAHELSPITKPISLYSYLFVLWVAFTIILLIFNSWLNFLPDEWSFKWAYFPSLRKRIQYYILAVTVGSFLIISLVTYFYYVNTTDNQFKSSILANTSKLRDDLENSLRNNNDPISTQFEERKEVHRLQAYLYAPNGTSLDREGAPMLPYPVYARIQQNQRNPFIYEDAAFAPVLSNGISTGILSVPLKAQNTFLLSELDDLITTLLNVYVFLFVLASGLAVAISNSITAPLKVLSEKLKGLKLGKKNEPLEWENKDELGELIQDYNRMIQQLEESARVLAATERETAWREMAKQVAHEIKNPLTPMKLSIQHLQIAMDKDGPPNEQLFQNVTRTLIEQIDNLNKIASEFSNFAKMPEPENEKVILNDVVASIHDLFRKREDMDINLFVPIDEISVFADKNHIMRVMNNLLKNAIQAIPTSRRGKIDIELYKEEENAIISVEDNGKGIPKEVRNKVFKPNFTSKSSGTGLGLAICANIIEGFNGKIYFETKEGEGTTFYVIIPLMRMEDNFRERERVIL